MRVIKSYLLVYDAEIKSAGRGFLEIERVNVLSHLFKS